MAPDEETIEVPLSALVGMFLALRLADTPNADERIRRCELAVLMLPLPVRQRVTRAAAQALRVNLERQH